MIKIVVWIISLILFSWCYSTIIMCLLFMKKIPTLKISLLIYVLITIALYGVSYFLLPNYFKSILICSLIALFLSFVTPKKV